MYCYSLGGSVEATSIPLNRVGVWDLEDRRKPLSVHGHPSDIVDYECGVPVLLALPELCHYLPSYLLAWASKPFQKLIIIYLFAVLQIDSCQFLILILSWTMYYAWYRLQGHRLKPAVSQLCHTGFQELFPRERCVESAFSLRGFPLMRRWKEKVEPGASFYKQ